MRLPIFCSALVLACSCGSSDPSGDAGVSDAAANPDTVASDPDNPDLQPNVDGGAAQPTGTAPQLNFAEARFSGRYGTDLLIQVQGADADGDATAMWLQFLDASGAPVARLDTDDDGEPDRADEVVAFDEPIHGLPEFETAFTLRRFFETPGDIAKAQIAIVDAEGSRSEMQTLEFIPQPQLGFGELCDPTYTLNRCEAGLGCREEPATCLEGLPPTITRLAYLNDFGAPRVLVEGFEPDDDMRLVRLEFLDDNDSAVSLDFNGDGSTDAATYDAFPEESYQGQFFFGLYPAESFMDTVSRIAATPVDAFGNAGERVVTDLVPIMERDWNQGCDPRGFDVCTQLATCVPGIPGQANKCGAPNRARQDQCEETTTLYVPNDDPLRFFGRSDGASLWEPAPDCVNEFGMNGPEEIVLLELSRGVPSLTLTTDFPNTDFDTVLYVMPGMCPAPGADGMYLGCADDAPGSLRSTLTLTNVPAGDYLVVIDSWDAQGGNFQLSVSTD